MALFWHSTAPGTVNKYTAADVHTMAHDDYVRFVGPDTRSDLGGMTNNQLIQDLAFHGLGFDPCLLQWDIIHAWVKLGYPVILGVLEDSVFDLDPQIKGRPYAWPPNGLSHIILYTGVGRFRDTANIGPGGVRPGPRQYDEARLRMISAMMVIPGWQLQKNGAVPMNFDPRSALPPPPAPAPAPAPYFQERSIWNSFEPIPFNPDFAIPASWLRAFHAGQFLGVPLTQEFQLNGITWQIFSSHIARWKSGESQVTWSGPHGQFVL